MMMMIKSNDSRCFLRFSFLLLLGVILLLQNVVHVVDGAEEVMDGVMVMQDGDETEEFDIGMLGGIELSDEVKKIVDDLRTVDKKMSAMDAAMIASLVDIVHKDQKTMVLLERLKAVTEDDEGEQENILANKTPFELIAALKQSYQEFKQLEMMLTDVPEALNQFEKEGALDEETLEKYRKNPEQMGDDMREGLYLMFATIAEAAGYFSME